MTQTSAFHFESLVWDWPIAIYLFLIGISAGLVTLAVLLRRFYPQAGGADSTLLRTTLIVGPGAVILGLLILVFHLTRPWTFWKLMFHYSFTSVMSMGVMLFQLYMVVLVLWLAKIFEHDLLALQQRWLPKLGIVQKVLSLLTPVHRGLETLMLVLAVLLGAYTGFLLSALKSYPFLNNPILPVLFLFSGISSGAAVALIAMAIRQRKNPYSTEAHFIHRMEIPVVWGEIFLLVAFFVGLALGDDGKVRALVAALGGGIGWRFLDVVVLAWCRRAGADCANVAQTVGQSQFRHSCRAGGVWGQSGRRVDAALFHSLRRTVDGGVSQKRGGFWTYSFLKSVFWRCY